MSLFPAQPRRRAFTLVELLVVIAVLGVLAAILIPVVGRVRSSAHATHCLSNMQQVGRALTLYAHDHRGFLPAPVDTHGTGAPWFVAIHPYAGTPWKPAVPIDEQLAGIFHCPTWSLQDHAPDLGDIGYAMSASLGLGFEAARPVSLSLIQQPTRRVMVLEITGTSVPYFPASGADVATFATDYASRFATDGCDRHDGSANYLFADGHVGRHTPAEAAILLK